MQVKATVEGVSDTVAALRTFDRETPKAVNAEIYQEVKPLVGQARALAPESSPMSNWDNVGVGEWGERLGFAPSAVKMGIGTKIAPMRQRGINTKERTIFLAQRNPAGVIYETAGRRSRGRSPQGRQFIENIENRSEVVVIGKQTRILWPVVQDNRKRITSAVGSIIAKKIRTTNTRLART
jgi:hypothetical protein